MNSNKKNQSGFTLIELLVVITVLVILATFLIPQVGTIRERGRRAACLENLRIIGIGLHTFAADNNGAFPQGDPASTAFQGIYTTGNITDVNVFKCPSSTATAPTGTLGGTDLTAVQYNYNNTNLTDQSDGTTAIVADKSTNHTSPAGFNILHVSGNVNQNTTYPFGTDVD